jgi:TRAP-type mannitol/chloroaromatic compound transport system substrate-binding protein
MKNRIFLVSLIALLGVSLVAHGCPPVPPVVEAPVPAPPEVIRWIGQEKNPAGTPIFLSFKRANELIYKSSGGRMVIESHPGGAIVPAFEELMAVDKGILDVASNAAIVWVGELPVAPIFTAIVGGPTAMEYFFWYKVGPGLDLMNEMFEDAGLNVKAIAATAREPEVFLYTDFYIAGPEDLRGRMLRLLGDEAKIFAPFGVSAVAVPAGEVYESMARGVIDGFQLSNLAADIRFGVHEIVDYAWLSPLRQPTDISIFIVNRDSWAALPPDLQVLIEQVWWAEGIRHFAESTLANTVAAATWIEAGVEILPIPRTVEEELIRLAEEFYAKREAVDPFFARVIASLREWRDKYKATFPRL